MTPTLKQIWVAVRQLQQDMNQIKIQVNEERALRSYLQQLLMGHLEGLSSTKNCWTPTDVQSRFCRTSRFSNQAHVCECALAFSSEIEEFFLNSLQ